jgi:integrase
MGRPKQNGGVYGPYYEEGRGWRVIVRSAGGQRRSRFFESEAAAQAHVDAVRQARQGQEARRLADLLTSWVGAMRLRGLKESTLDREKRFALLFWGDPETRLLALTPELARRRYRALQEAGYAAATHRGCLEAAKAFGAWLVREEILPENPCEGIKKEGRVNRRKPQLTLDEARTLARVALAEARAGDHGALVVLCCLLLGMRRGEVVGMKRRSLDDGGRLLRVEDAKTAAGIRVLEVPEVLQPLLLARAEGRKADDRLFPYSGVWAWRQVKRLCQIADVGSAERPISPHGLRGSHATLAMEAGATPRLVAAALGHTSAAMTLENYAAPGSEERGRQKKVALALVK